MRIDTTNYYINEITQYDGTTKIVLSPKKRNCKLCKRVFDSVGTEFICWNDSKGFSRSGYFCREHFKLIHKVLKEIR